MIQLTGLHLVGILLFASSAAVQGAQIAFDSAGDSAYNSGWSQGSNGGFGWGSGWSLGFFGPGQAFLGDSTTNGSGDPEGDGDINSPRVVGGRAWGLIDGSATRLFSSPLSPGQTFSIDLDDYGASSVNFFSMVSLLAPGGARAVSFTANRSAANHYRLEAAGTDIDTGVPDTDQGIHIAFTELSSGVQVSLTPYIAGASTTTLIAPYTGQLTGMEFDSVAEPLYLTPYINNIAITPEPAGLGLLALTVPALTMCRRRGQ
jgi:hypothetical protein